jgi:MFS transporter, Spinster family, sphingosine-1-phosphate transporter
MSEAAYKKYLLGVLAVSLAFNYVDRLALGLLLQDIKVDLALTDTQLGLLSGIAFALFYSVMGLPIAHWADRGNRVAIISISTALWSGALALCGLAGNFLQLLLIRIGVAVGEAGCNPSAHSLIADYFSRAERPRAVSVYLLGGALSGVIGYFAAGWLNELYGWRVTFALLGTPGLGLSLLVWMTLKEPRRAGPVSFAEAPGVPAAAHPALKEVYATLWGNRTFCHLLLYFSILFFFNYGITSWKPAFFIRSYGLDTGELGLWFTLIYGISGIVGIYWGGEWASRRARNNESLQLKVMAAVVSCFGLVSAGIYLSPSSYMAFALMALAGVGGAITSGPLFATIQTLVPSRMRAMAIAIMYMFANLIGMGLGPLAVGALSDALHGFLGEESLRYALLSMCPGYLWAAFHLLRASRTVTEDLHAGERFEQRGVHAGGVAEGRSEPVTSEALP